jgi:hypothetical protein
MQVRFRGIPEEGLPESHRELGYSQSTRFDLKRDRVYFVGGICIWGRAIHYLLDPEEDGFPGWYPASLFKIVEGKLPSNWHFTFRQEPATRSISAVWGYAELMSPSHFEALVERNPEALGVFRERWREAKT